MNRFLSTCFMSILLFSGSINYGMVGVAEGVIEVSEDVILDSALSTLVGEVGAEVDLSAVREAARGVMKDMVNEANGILSKVAEDVDADALKAALQNEIYLAIDKEIGNFIENRVEDNLAFVEEIKTNLPNSSISFNQTVESLKSLDVVTKEQAETLMKNLKISNEAAADLEGEGYKGFNFGSKESGEFTYESLQNDLSVFYDGDAPTEQASKSTVDNAIDKIAKRYIDELDRIDNILKDVTSVTDKDALRKSLIESLNAEFNKMTRVGSLDELVLNIDSTLNSTVADSLNSVGRILEEAGVDAEEWESIYASMVKEIMTDRYSSYLESTFESQINKGMVETVGSKLGEAYEKEFIKIDDLCTDIENKGSGDTAKASAKQAAGDLRKTLMDNLDTKFNSIANEGDYGKMFGDFEGTMASTRKSLGDFTTKELESSLDTLIEKDVIKAGEKEAIVGEYTEMLEDAEAEVQKAKTKRIGWADAAVEKGKKVGKFFGEALKIGIAGIVMMIPQTFVSALISLEEKVALLESITPPIKIGDYVLQIPSQFINTDNPEDSIFLYNMLPLSSTTVKIDSLPGVEKIWPGITGPTTDATLKIFTPETGKEFGRYELTPEYLENANWVCTYPANEDATGWADTYMNSPAASGKFVVLNNGFVFVGDGTSGGNDSIKLLQTPESGMNVLDAITDLSSRINLSSTVHTASEGSFFKPTISNKDLDSDIVSRLFDCTCLHDENSLNSCAEDDQSCVLMKFAQESIPAGLAIDGNGEQITNMIIHEGNLLTSGSDLAGSAETSAANAPDTTGLDILKFIVDVGTATASAALKGVKIEKIDSSIDSDSSKVASDVNKDTDTTPDNDGSDYDGVSGEALDLDDYKKVSKQGSSKKSMKAQALAAVASAVQKNSSKKKEIQAQALTGDNAEALGSVIPVFGWGDVDFIDSFAIEKETLAQYVQSKPQPEGDKEDSSKVTYSAPRGDYAERMVETGSNIYCCSNTPFTRALRDAMGQQALFNDISEMSPAGPIVDYIIFLDEFENQIPLMVLKKELIYGTEGNLNAAYMPKYVLNPAIDSWVSLISVDMPEFGGGVKYKIKDNRSTATTKFDPVSGETDINNSNVKKYFDDISNNVSPELSSQLFAHKSAMKQQLRKGPFGKDRISTTDALTYDGTALYEKYNCPFYPVGDEEITDYLLPLFSSGGNLTTVRLPISDKNPVSFYYGLVTDVKYEQVDGKIIPIDVQPNTPFLSKNENDNSYEIVDPNNSSLRVFNGLFLPNVPKAKLNPENGEYMNYSEDEAGIVTFIDINPFSEQLKLLAPKLQTNRAQWLAKMQAFNDSAVPAHLASGVKFESVTAKLFTTASAVSGCPLWILEGDSIEYGLYVAVKSISSFSLVTKDQMSADDKNIIFVDLISGLVINQQGEKVFADNGDVIHVDPEAAVQSLKANYPDAFNQAYEDAFERRKIQYDLLAQEKMFPIPYGDKSLGIYRGDKDLGSYIYWTQNNNTIVDYFIVKTGELSDDGQTLKNPQLNVSINNSSAYLISLVTGDIYRTEGRVGTLEKEDRNNLVAQLTRSGILSETIKNDIPRLASYADSLAERQQAEEVYRANLEQKTRDRSGMSVKYLDKDRALVANRLAKKEFLTYPYGSLKYDDLDKKYYHVAEVNPIDGGGHLILDFDVPLIDSDGNDVEKVVDENGNVDLNFQRCHIFYSNGQILESSSVTGSEVSSATGAKDVDGNPVPDGSVQATFDDVLHIKSFRTMYGVTIDSTGKQSLSAASLEPMLTLKVGDLDDTSLAVGKSGTIMVLGGSSEFPKNTDISTPLLGTDDSGVKYYAYYNNQMRSYYAMANKSGTEPYWLSMTDDGGKYFINGDRKKLSNPVAFYGNPNNGEFLLPYEDDDGYVACFFKNEDNDLYEHYFNDSEQFQYLENKTRGLQISENSMMSIDGTQAKVMAAPHDLPVIEKATGYYVGHGSDYLTKNKAFNVADGYNWNHLRIMGHVDDLRAHMAIVYKGSNSIEYVIFAKQKYTLKSASNPTFVMTNGTNDITVTLMKSVDGVSYVNVKTPDKSDLGYDYQYDFDNLTYDQMQKLQKDVWKVGLAVSSGGKALLVNNLNIDEGNFETLQGVSESIEDYDNVSEKLNEEVPGKTGTTYMDLLADGLSKIYRNRVDGNYYVKFTGNELSDLTVYDESDYEWARLWDGVKYNSENGIPTIACLRHNQWIELLDALQVAVKRKSNGTFGLYYNQPIINTETEVNTGIGGATV